VKNVAAKPNVIVLVTTKSAGAHTKSGWFVPTLPADSYLSPGNANPWLGIPIHVTVLLPPGPPSSLTLATCVTVGNSTEQW